MLRVDFLRIVLLTVLLSPFPAAAQQWIDYANREYRFMINFPAEPVESETVYASTGGEVVDSRVFSAERGSGRYTVTVVVFRPETFHPDDELDHAARTLAQRGAIQYEGPTLYDGIPVLETSIIDADGRQIMATILAHDRYLHIVEADVGPEMGPPIHFPQSVVIIDGEGNRVEIDH